MKIEAGGLAPSRTRIGEIAYLAPAGGEPLATPQSDLAIFSCGTEDPGLPVDVEVNGEPQTTDTVQTVGAVQRQQASVAWSSSAGVIERGHVIDPAALPEARLPAGTDRVVIAADDPTKEIDEHLLGSPVTAEIGSSTRNLGIVTEIDSGRRWIVVELIDRFLSDRRAWLVGS